METLRHVFSRRGSVGARMRAWYVCLAMSMLQRGVVATYGVAYDRRPINGRRRV